MTAKKRKSVVSTQASSINDPMELEYRLERKLKRQWDFSVACMATRFFLDGLEYAIVIPTLYGFLLKMGAEVKMLGVIGASYALGGFTAAPIFGNISDKIGNGKIIILFGCLLSILGNLIYFVAQNQWYLVIGRFFCGLSSGVEPVILGEIGKCEAVKEEKRSGLFSMLFTIRQTGILFGPVFVIAFSLINLNIFGFTIDIYNFGGFFCACLFGLCLMMFLTFYNVNTVDEADDSLHSVNEAARLEGIKEDEENDMVPLKDSERIRSNTIGDTDFKEKITEKFMGNILDGTKLLHGKVQEKLGSQITLIDPMNASAIQGHKRPKEFHASQISLKTGGWHDLLCEPVLIGLFGTYAIYVQQATVETIVAPTTDRLLGFKPEDNAFLLIAVGMELVIGFLSVGPMTKLVGEQGVLRIGSTIMSFMCLIIMTYSPCLGVNLWLNLILIKRKSSII